MPRSNNTGDKNKSTTRKRKRKRKQKKPKPLCRFFYNGECRRGDKCKFSHPIEFTRQTHTEGKRKSGHCYCGSEQRTIVGTKLNRDDVPIFFKVCGRTGRSMKRCK